MSRIKTQYQKIVNRLEKRQAEILSQRGGTITSLKAINST